MMPSIARRSVGPGSRVLSVTGVLCVLGVIGYQLTYGSTPPLASTVYIPWWMLSALFAVTEMYVLHLPIRREAQTVSLSEIPLALGLLCASPATLLSGRLAGVVLVFIFYRRQRSLKVTYNTALTLADTALALVVFYAVLGDSPVFGVRSWLAVYLALAAAGALDALATTLVISFYEDSVRLRDLRAQVLAAAPVSAAVGTVAVAAAYALAADPRSAWALLGCAALLVIGYRGYASLRERHLSLERLYRFSQVVGSAADSDGALLSVLRQASELLRAERAEITFFPDGPEAVGRVLSLGPTGFPQRCDIAGARVLDELTQEVVRGGKPVLLPRKTKNQRLRRHLDERSLREAVVVPLGGESQVLGALRVADRVGQVRTFDGSDVRLLETIANHASVALSRGRLVDQLRHEASHDALTGLPNRTALRHDLQQALFGVSAGRVGEGIAVLLMDLDGFKEINDTLGHHQGDLLLQEVAARMRAAAPRSANLARLGGDEFAILLRDVADYGSAEQQARGLLAALQPPCTLDGIRVEVRASIGIALAPEDGADAAALLKRADIAMYAAKVHGRGVQRYEPTLQEEVRRRLALSGELRSAIAAEQLTVYVQPQADLATGEVVGVEALVRWQHPDEGLLRPDEFISLAERSGLMEQLTSLVLDKSLEVNAAWRDAGVAIGVSVNLSARSLAYPEFVDQVAELLDKHGVPASALTLEITEGIVVTETGRSMEVLHRLAAMGVRLSIDDFGTGQSSLTYLRMLPVREIKIDKSFVSGMVSRADDAAIVRAIVDLGSNLRLDVIAEGIESRTAWERLSALGAATGQGYYIGRPMPADELLGWLRNRERRARQRLAVKARVVA